MNDKKPSQAELLYKLLADGLAHRTDQIQALVYGGNHLGLARVGARIWDIKKKHNVEIKGWKDKENPSLYWYQIVLKFPELSKDARTPEAILNLEKAKQGALI
jgi:hypothetical protein